MADRVVGFFGGVGYFGVGFFRCVVQVVGFVWHGPSGLWCGDYCLVWWKLAWNCGGCGKSAWNSVCGSMVAPLVFFFFFLNMVLLLV